MGQANLHHTRHVEPRTLPRLLRTQSACRQLRMFYVGDLAFVAVGRLGLFRTTLCDQTIFGTAPGGHRCLTHRNILFRGYPWFSGDDGHIAC